MEKLYDPDKFSNLERERGEISGEQRSRNHDRELPEKVDKSMTDVSKTRRQEVLKTLKSHIMDALEDQKGRIPEARIVKNTIKDLGTPKKKSLAQKLAPGSL